MFANKRDMPLNDRDLKWMYDSVNKLPKQDKREFI